ncbi:hypothetical protein CR513_44912, partial [Mucuna pruriens]
MWHVPTICEHSQGPTRTIAFGVDILGLLPVVVWQIKYLIVVVNYFMNWIEAESFVTISAKRIRRFY